MRVVFLRDAPGVTLPPGLVFDERICFQITNKMCRQIVISDTSIAASVNIDHAWYDVCIPWSSVVSVLIPGDPWTHTRTPAHNLN